MVLIFAVGVECGENRGRTGGAQKNRGENRGHLGREPGDNRGLLAFIYKEYRGRSGAFGIHLQRVPGEKQGALGHFLKGGKRPPPQDFSLTKKTARFTKGQFRPY